ncbi:MAG: ComF family protein [Akkermansia sp.]|nr:ComF family protein [Akkermansia sp.]
MLSWLFPSTCELCGETADMTICQDCLRKLPRIPAPICLHCGAPTAGQQTDPDRCEECAGHKRSFLMARQALRQTDEVMQLIYAFKYHKAIHLAQPLAELLNELWEKTPHLRGRTDWVLVPVPVTHSKLYTRGFNQAGELASALGRCRKLRVENLLIRRETGVTSQTRLTASARRLNAMRAYRPKRPGLFARRRIYPARLVLVDDVFTTGATARACATQLKKLPGVKEVVVLSLVRIGT